MALRRLVPVRASGLGAETNLVSRALETASSGLQSQVRRVTLRSNLSPEITLSPAEAAGPDRGGIRRQGGLSEFLWGIAKPEIEVETSVGTFRVAAWGRPTTNLFWPLVILGGAGAIAIGVLAVKGLKK